MDASEFIPLAVLSRWLRLSQRTEAILWQGYSGDRHWFHSWGQVSGCWDEIEQVPHKMPV